MQCVKFDVQCFLSKYLLPTSNPGVFQLEFEAAQSQLCAGKLVSLLPKKEQLAFVIFIGSTGVL